MMHDELGRVFIYGRLRNLARGRVSELLVNAGGQIVRDAARAETIVVARRALAACVTADGDLDPRVTGRAVRLLSEGAFRRRLGVDLADAPFLAGAYGLAEVARLSGLPVDQCRALALFDVIGAGEDRFAYRDLAVARQVASLKAQGSAMRSIIETAWALEASGLTLAQVRLVEAPWGEVVQQVGTRIAGLNGQFALVFDEAVQDAQASLARARLSEEEGALDEAERWYRRAAQADRRDPLAAFNLGNVLAALGRDAEAVIAFQQALAIDPAFVEAAFNLAGVYEKTGQLDRAIALYDRTTRSHPAYGQALYNHARLLTLGQRFAEALPLWDRFIALAPADADLAHARRAALLCRMELR